MKILFDHQAFNGLKFGGISRYFHNLMEFYDGRTDIDFDLALWFSNNYYIQHSNFSSHIKYEQFSGSKNVNRAFSLLNRMNSTRMLEKGDFDIFHPTFYHQYFLKNLNKKPFVLTFHDVTNEKFHQNFAEIGGDLSKLKQKLLNKADIVIAVSQNTKNDIIEYFNISEEKIKVIHLGTTLGNAPMVSETMLDTLPKNYLLYVGNRDAFKNFEFFLRNAGEVMKKFPEIQIVCAGAGIFSRKEFQLIESLKRVQHFPVIIDDMFYPIYKNAIAFVFPSLYEGFGIPVIEAFTSGCPALLSNQGSLPEIGGNAALYFDPKNSEEFQVQLYKVLIDSDLRKKMVIKGNERIKLFSCEKTALETLDVYKSLTN
jgi:glycosyltransferase involved in cell wall biosynthesis